MGAETREERRGEREGRDALSTGPPGTRGRHVPCRTHRMACAVSTLGCLTLIAGWGGHHLCGLDSSWKPSSDGMICVTAEE